MAEAVVIALVEAIATALAPEALNQACFRISWVKEARARILQVRSEFIVMQAFLKSAEEIKGKNEAARAWMEEVRDAAYQVEDLIDEYTHLMNKRTKTGLLHKSISDTRHAKAWRQIVVRLRDVESKLLNLSDAGHRYRIKTDEGNASHGVYERRWQLAESAHFTEENEIVGIEKNREVLIGWLTDTDSQRTIASVWGMGGLGKTTIVTNVYNRLKMKSSHFNCYAWVSVSQNNTTNDLLRRIIRELQEENKDLSQNNIDAMDYRRLVEALRNYLRHKRYLIVLDDAWKKDVWACIDAAFVDSNCGSRIVITTRVHDVASLAVDSHILKLQPLEENAAWTLFCRNAFRREMDSSCPPELRCWAQKILRKCEGLPLAIAAIGSLLSLKPRGELAWKRVHDDLSWEMTENGELNSVSSNILNLSFNDLPHHLKNCFLYCGMFPEGYLIKRSRLLRLWVAEGFIQDRTGSTMEETGEGYLEELIHRCMLQVAERNNFGRVKACRMHDLLRDVVISKSRKEKFSEVHDSNSEGRMGDRARRLSLNKHNGVLQLGEGMENLRSFFVFDAAIFSSSSSDMLQSVVSRFRLLRVLDLRRVPIETVPNQVLQLFNLRYLGLRQTNIKKIPYSIGRLQNLQTLDLWGTNVKNAPKGIARLKLLRHLLVGVIPVPTSTAYNPFCGMAVTQGICHLKGLQTMMHVRATEEIIEHVGSLVDMRSFGITEVRYNHGKKLSTSITKMHHLLSLSIVARDEKEALSLKDLYPPPPHLQKLLLQGRLENGMVPHWFLALKNLLHLELYWSGLIEDPLPALSLLPNLIDMRLLKAYDGQKLCFQRGCFPKLRKLFLCNLTQLNWIKFEMGTLLSLHELILVRCSELKVAPRGIENLEALEILELVEMPQELKEGLQMMEKEDHLQVRHIPDIRTWQGTEKT